MTQAHNEEEKRAAAFLTRKIIIEPRPPKQVASEKAASEESRRRDSLMRDYAAVSAAKPGDIMPDGSIYLGTRYEREWFVAAEDIKDHRGGNILLNFNEAAAAAKNLRAHDRDDWVLPPSRILKHMYFQRDAGAFQGSYSPGSNGHKSFYWSSTLSSTGSDYGAASEVTLGLTCYFNKTAEFSVRCVRSIPKISCAAP